jgi:hypothetical protein
MDERFSAASFKDSMEEQGMAVIKNRLTPHREYAGIVGTVADVDRQARRTGVLRRCFLNPANFILH